MGIRRLCLVGTLCLGSAAAAAEPTLWKTVGWWDVKFYPDDKGCSASTVFEAGTTFFIGFSMIENDLGFEIYMYDKSWGSIEKGKEYPIRVTFGDETPWDLDMTGVESVNGWPGLRFWNSADSGKIDRFLGEFQRELSMEWRYRGSSLGKLSLRGSRAAFTEVMACQTSFLDALADRDPFADGSTSPGGDPFSE